MAAPRLTTVGVLALVMWLLSAAGLTAWFACSQALGSFGERLTRLGSRLLSAGG